MDAAELAFAGPLRQAELIRDGEISPRELVQVYLDRIERIEPELNAFRVVLAERALTEAKQAARRKASQDRPLLGVPVRDQGQPRPDRRGHDARDGRLRPHPGRRRTPRSCAV